MKTSQKIWALIGFLFASLGAGAIGTIFTLPNVDGWYSTASKPPWNPPDWLFGPVWTVLYVFIGVGAWLVWLKIEHASRKKAMILFWTQMGLNAIWTPIFFGGYPVFGTAALWIGLGVIVLLDFVVIMLIFSYKKLNVWAAVLMIPYLLWILFATSLNAALAVLN